MRRRGELWRNCWWRVAARRVDACALLTAMDQPLGRTIGNALEVQEAIATLKGEGPRDLRELCLALGGEMLYLAGKATDPEEGQATLARLLDSGAALAKMVQWLKAQGGNPKVVDDPKLVPQPATVVDVKAPQAGYVTALNARELAMVAMGLGGGEGHQGCPHRSDRGHRPREEDRRLCGGGGSVGHPAKQQHHQSRPDPHRPGIFPDWRPSRANAPDLRTNTSQFQPTGITPPN